MHPVTGEDGMIARIVARPVHDLGGILERLTAFAQPNASVVLSTPIPQRKPLPAHQTG